MSQEIEIGQGTLLGPRRIQELGVQYFVGQAVRDNIVNASPLWAGARRRLVARAVAKLGGMHFEQGRRLEGSTLVSVVWRRATVAVVLVNRSLETQQAVVWVPHLRTRAGVWVGLARAQVVERGDWPHIQMRVRTDRRVVRGSYIDWN